MGVEGVSRNEADHDDDHKGHGPLAPWRLSIAVGLSAALTGPALWDATMSDQQVDFALLRSFGVFFLSWLAMGVINRTLVRASRAPRQPPSFAENERADRA
jgi:hypothetical protein